MKRPSVISKFVERLAPTRTRTVRTTARQRSSSGDVPRARVIARTIVAAAVGSSLLVTGAVAPAAADTDDDLDLGPQVVRTDEGPTGYAVTFRYKAPAGVQQVRIWGEWQFSNPQTLEQTRTSDGRMGWDWQPGDTVAAAGPGFFPAFPALDMTLGEDGVWTWTTPLPSGRWSYRFVHDCGGVQGIDGCTSYPDPANLNWANGLTPTGAQTVSSIWVPSHPEFPTYDHDLQKPTPPERTGRFEHRQYVSPESTSPVGTHYVAVYLPAGYDADRAVPYPTLYLSHGLGGNEGTFFVQALANDLMENVVAAGRAQPMVIVTTNFNGIPGGDAGYARDLTQNVIPFIEREYNVSTLAADRAFGGQSMGAQRGIGLLYNYTPNFEYYGLWAAAGGGNPNAEQVERMRQLRGVIHMGTGLQDFVGNIGPNSIARAQTLRNHGLNLMEFNTNGTHTWVAARPLLEDFLKNAVFRSTETTLSVVYKGTAGIEVSADVAPLGTSHAAPTGTVEFRRDGEVLGAAQLDASGSARLDAVVGSAEGIQAHYLGDNLFNASVSEPGVRALNVAVTAETRCVAGKVILTARLSNGEPVPVLAAISSAYGERPSAGVAPGKNASYTFATRLASVPAGSISVALSAVSGEEVTTSATADFGARSCD